MIIKSLKRSKEKIPMLNDMPRLRYRRPLKLHRSTLTVTPMYFISKKVRKFKPRLHYTFDELICSGGYNFSVDRKRTLWEYSRISLGRIKV